VTRQHSSARTAGVRGLTLHVSLARAQNQFLFCGLALMALFVSAPRVRAEAGALLPVRAETAVPFDDRESALESAVSFFARLPEPIPLALPEDGAARTKAQFHGCDDAGCAAAYAQALEVDFAVLVQLFEPDTEHVTGSLRAAIVTAQGVRYGAEVETGAVGMHAAVARALASAYERYRRGPGPWLTVAGPEGSEARIDERAATLLPFTDRYAPGEHHVRVTSEHGELLYDGVVRLPEELAHHERLEVGPEPMARTTRPDDAQREHSYWQRRRSKWNYLIGVPVAIAGAFYTAVGISHYARRGSCARRSEGLCVERNAVDGTSRAALILGISGIAVGAGLFMGAGVLREGPHRDMAFWTLGGTF
jgi:hypothetical protein